MRTSLLTLFFMASISSLSLATTQAFKMDLRRMVGFVSKRLLRHHAVPDSARYA